MCPDSPDKEEENEKSEADDPEWDNLVTVDDEPPIREGHMIKSGKAPQ